MNTFKKVKCGDRFGKWLVVSDRTGCNPPSVKCVCECGTTKDVLVRHLFSGESTKCVKCNAKIQGERRRKIGRDTSAYIIYKRIVHRCKGKDKKHPQYKDMEYCSFEEFFEEIGERPSATLSVDRIDNTKGYIKGNLRWATAKQQQNNKSNTIYFRDKSGNKYCLTEICEKYGLNYNTARSPRYRNMSLEELVHAVRNAERQK